MPSIYLTPNNSLGLSSQPQLQPQRQLRRSDAQADIDLSESVDTSRTIRHTNPYAEYAANGMGLSPRTLGVVTPDDQNAPPVRAPRGRVPDEPLRVTASPSQLAFWDKQARISALETELSQLTGTASIQKREEIERELFALSEANVTETNFNLRREIEEWLNDKAKDYPALRRR